MSMFCYQCEQTAKGTGCNMMGVCGKDPKTARIQDMLTHMVMGISRYAHRAAQAGVRKAEVDRFVIQALFATVTNVDFDAEHLREHIRKALEINQKAKALYEQACSKTGQTPEALECPADEAPALDDLDKLAEQGARVGIEKYKESLGEDKAGVHQMILYGLKGAAAYADHALVLGKEDAALFADFHATLDFLAGREFEMDALLGQALKAGDINMRAMELLDAANTGAFGHPEPTQARITPRKGKAIVVSGHDLKDLKILLEQTEGKGVNIYTHGEMLPGLAYPELKKFKHLAGNYGGAWQDQATEFDAFPGAILMTTNCIQKPRDNYKGRIFTTGLVKWPGVTHIGEGKDFTPVIEAALAAEGFAEDGPDQTIPIGFARNTVMSVADKVIDAVKQGAIRHFFLVGGCDGAKTGRNYYTEFAQGVPDDCVILTLACGKYRFNKLEFGDIGGIPRILDIGQCNDAYSAVQIAVALANAFECGVNDLPLSLVLSWYEQKAVAILLTLLNLGIRGIRLGPSLPAFVTEPVLNVLIEKFDIKPIGSPQEDLQAILAS